MSKHTRGPWRVDERRGDMSILGHPTWKCRRFGVDGEWEIASIADLDEDREEERLANAALVAAAPDLLEVVKSFVAETVDYMTLNKLGDPEQQHNVKWARRIIAKAEGRS